MKATRTSRYTSPALLSSLLLLLALPLQAQDTGEKPRPTKYVVDSLNIEQKQVFFQGFTLSGDVFGLVQKFTSDYGVFEGALRVNFKNQFFPIVEAGYAICDATDVNTHINYKTKAPYLRAGLDVNMLKNKWQDNRLYLGVRYGISKFNYDLGGFAQTDPVWGGSRPFQYNGLSSTAHWVEFIAGVQVKIWGSFHMGWSVRFKSAISKGTTDFSTPYYIPGYGTTSSGTCWGATFNLSFDLNWGRKKQKMILNAVVHPIDTTTPQQNLKDEETPQQTGEETLPEE